MSNTVAATQKIVMNRFRLPQTAISRFVARRSLRSATLWALVFGGYVASKAIGFANAYPTEAARQRVAATFSNNIGIEVILGPIRHADTVGGYATWNTLGVMIIVGSIWAFLLAGKTFRGEEDAGRWELLLSGQTTARRAAVNALVGLGASLSIFYVIIAAAFSLVGKAHGVGFDIDSALFFALAVVSGVSVFMMVGALASQLMPTRSRSASVSAGVLAVSFLLRAVADITSAHWLLNFTPLGWVEKLQPLSDSQPAWLLPIIGLTITLAGLTIFFAGRRDLGASIFSDKDTSKSHTRLLNSPFLAAFRLTRANSIAWLTAAFVSATLYGLLTKTTIQAFSQSTSAQHVLSRLAHQSQIVSASAFLGVVFFLQMVLIMAYAAGSVAAIRRDEAEGYIDNLLVGPVSRARWLSGRIFLCIAVIISAGLLTSFGTWIGAASQHVGISFHTLFLASANLLVPVSFTVGVGIFAFGIRPRATSLIAFSVLAWSFLIEMISSGINLNHWILDTSILNHIVFAPAASPRWSTDGLIIIIAIILCGIGAIIFNRRDLATE
jgi:ABC-2 type transport system permease protein